MDFQIIDMVIVAIILFLAIKGIVHGFSKELFNFLGLIGGIAVAARTNEMAGDLIVEQGILPETLLQYKGIIGFIAIFVIIWVLFNLISSLLATFTSEEVSVPSRMLGYIIAIARYAFIFSLIIFGFNNANFIKEKFSKYTEQSQLFVPMSKVGERLLNRVNSENNATINRDNNRTKVDLNSTTTIETSATKENNESQ